MIIPIQAGVATTIHEVGGKAFNLIKMLDAQLQVPQGFVLTVDFFAAWLDTLQTTKAWDDFLSVADSELEAACKALQETCQTYTFGARQREQLAPFLDRCDDDALFAVRSSSPEEDLEGSSFAGAYETTLGVTKETFAQAVLTAFVSCLDYRIAAYKKQKGFSTQTPKIAVVVQEQIASEVAGVGFSINPLTNSYDEALFAASWGLGDTVVAGIVSPDSFTVDKHTKQIIEQTLGDKETALWALPGGGIEERRDPRYGEYSLTQGQVSALTEQLNRVEAHYQLPVDIEWAFAKGQLYLLQARPITTYLQLADEMLTRLGQPRRLYLDFTLSVQGFFDPLSRLGNSFFQRLSKHLGLEMIGRDLSDVRTGLLVVSEGRAYFQVSNLLHVAGKERLVKVLRQMDELASTALQQIDERQYPSSISKFKLVLSLLMRMYPRIRNIIRAFRTPRATLERWHRGWEQHKIALSQKQQITDLTAYVEDTYTTTIRFIARETGIMFVSAKIAMGRIRKLFPEPSQEVQDWLAQLDISLPGNVTVEMGLALFQLREHLDMERTWTVEELVQGIQEKTLPSGFLAAWDAFISRYGHRANREIDVASPRYWEQPETLLQQLMSFMHMKPEDSPVLRHESAQVTRTQARDALSATLAKSPRKQRKFLSLHNVVETLGGARETHKFVMVYLFDQIRRRLLAEATKLQQANRIEEIDDIFYLSLEDVIASLAAPTLDIKVLVKQGKRAHAKASQCKQIFPLIDSRGRFYRPPPREAGPGEVAGQGVSAGIATGPVKVLNSPDEKPLLAGEILVARATDPAWTPLFVNAAAIVLQVGGPLQHGALVAREYGKPCVSGIQDVTKKFRDGEWIEVNGASGIVKRIPTPAHTPPSN